MFEKEAETTFKKKATKIAEKKVKEFYKECGWEDYKYMIPEFADVGIKCMQKGAEFGYKKGQSDQLVHKQYQLNQLRKANEWHYVKDGDLPKKTGEYLVYKISGYGSKSIELIQYNSSRQFWCLDCQNEVIAWKEIVLPKESEDEQF